MALSMSCEREYLVVKCQYWQFWSLIICTWTQKEFFPILFLLESYLRKSKIRSNYASPLSFVLVLCQQIKGKEIPKIMFPISNVSYPIHDWGLAEFEKWIEWGMLDVGMDGGKWILKDAIIKCIDNRQNMIRNDQILFRTWRCGLSKL